MLLIYLRLKINSCQILNNLYNLRILRQQTASPKTRNYFSTYSQYRRNKIIWYSVSCKKSKEIIKFIRLIYPHKSRLILLKIYSCPHLTQ